MGLGGLASSEDSPHQQQNSKHVRCSIIPCIYGQMVQWNMKMLKVEVHRAVTVYRLRAQVQAHSFDLI